MKAVSISYTKSAATRYLLSIFLTCKPMTAESEARSLLMWFATP